MFVKRGRKAPFQGNLADKRKEEEENIKELQQALASSKLIDGQLHLLFETLLEEIKKGASGQEASHMKTLLCVKDAKAKMLLVESLTKRGHLVSVVEPDEVLTTYSQEPCSMIIFDDTFDQKPSNNNNNNNNNTNKNNNNNNSNNNFQKKEEKGEQEEDEDDEETNVKTIELCQHVRSVVGDFVVMLLITNHTQIEELEKIMDAGVNDYLHRDSLDLKYLEVRLMSAERQILASVKIKQSDEFQAVTKRLILCFECSGDIVEVWDRQGRIQYVNKRGPVLTGYPRGEIIGSQFMMHMTSSDEYNHVWNTITDGNTFSGQISQRHRNMSAGRYDATISPVKNAQGDICAFFVVKRAQKNLDQAEEDRRVSGEKVAQKEYVRLRYMSYQIQTLLTDILGVSQLMNEELSSSATSSATSSPLTAHLKSYVSSVTDSADALQSVVTSLMSFFKIETRKLSLEVSQFNPREEIEKIVSQSPDHPLELVCYVQPEIPFRLLGDVGHFQQIVANLVSNAIKYTPAGEVSVSLYLYEETKDVVMLKLEVKDTGIGIDKELLPSLYEVNTYRETVSKASPAAVSISSASNERKANFGKGLGLSIVKELTEIVFQGEVGVDSVKGVGSTFWCNLKISKIPPEKLIGHEAPTLIDENEISLANKGVLVIEKSSTVRKILLEELSKIGVSKVKFFPFDSLPSSASLASIWEKILEILRESSKENQRVSMVILDLTSVGISVGGTAQPDFSIIANLRSLSSFALPPVHVVVLSPSYFKEPKDAVALEKRLITDYRVGGVLHKPLKQSILPFSLREVLKTPIEEVSLPTASASHAGEESKKESQVTATSSITSASGGSAATKASAPLVLIVDDNVVNRQVAQRMIQKLGCRILSAGNGQEALEAVQRDSDIKLVLMDCEMPVMDGYESTRQIRKFESEFPSESGDQKKPARLPIIAMTANVLFSNDVTRCLEIGMDDYLGKPIKLKDCKEKLQKWIPDF